MDRPERAARMRVGFSRAWGIAVLAGVVGLCGCLKPSATPAPQGPSAKDNEPPLEVVADRPFAFHFESDVTIELKQASIEGACRLLAKLSDVPVFLEPALAKSDLRLTLPKCTMPANEVARWIARSASASASVIADGFVLTAQGSPAKPIVRTYDVENLLPPGFVCVGRRDGVEGDDLPPHDRMLAEAHSLAATRIGLLAYLQSAVAPATWRRSDLEAKGVSWPPYAIHGFDRRLTVTQTAAGHEGVEDALNDFRKARSMMTSIQLWDIEAENGCYEAVRPRLHFRPAIVSSPKEMDDWTLSVARLMAEDTEALLSELKRGSRSTVLVVPRWELFNIQRGAFDLFPELSGDVRDREPRGAVTPNPERRLLNRLRITAQPFVSADRRMITLVLSFHELRPRSGLTERMICLTIPNGGSLLFEGLSHFDRDPKQQREGTVLLLLLNAKSLDDIFEE